MSKLGVKGEIDDKDAYRGGLKKNTFDIRLMCVLNDEKENRCERKCILSMLSLFNKIQIVPNTASFCKLKDIGHRNFFRKALYKLLGFYK